MEQYITPDRIANSILQDKSFSGHYILVEGKKDLKIYSRLLLKEAARPKVTFGKYKLREAYELLEQRGFFKKIGIRDADFLRIAGNTKYDPNFKKSIFVTDNHDAELMMIESGVLDDVCAIIADSEKVQALESRHSSSLLEIILKNLYPLGCLKLANKRFSLGLSFKPERPGGNRLRIDRFISGRDCKFIGNNEMINAVYEYSKNRSEKIATREEISLKLASIVAEGHPEKEIVHGHDAAEFLHMIFREALNVKIKTIQDPDCVENFLTSNFDWMKFTSTELYRQIRKWQDESGANIFRYP